LRRRRRLRLGDSLIDFWKRGVGKQVGKNVNMERDRVPLRKVFFRWG
jgi:hypothetical protein